MAAFTKEFFESVESLILKEVFSDGVMIAWFCYLVLK